MNRLTIFLGSSLALSITMGSTTSTLVARYWSPRKEIKVILHGLDASGKTSLLYKLKKPYQEVVTTIPTIGFNVETICIDAFEFTAWDVGGRDKIRPLWRHYYPGVEALIFVVDSVDRDRMDSAVDEFHRILNEDLLQNIPVLLYCNKQDLPNALNPINVAERFAVSDGNQCGSHLVVVQGCSVYTGQGLQDGVRKLSHALKTRNKLSKPYLNMGKADGTRGESAPTTSRNGDDTEFKAFYLNNATLERFAQIKKATECPFAKAAKLWGGLSETNKSLENQAKSQVEGLVEFTHRSNAGEKLDGFCIDVDAEAARSGGPNEFGECVRRLLAAIAEQDPSGENSMKMSSVGARGWRFRFNKTDFFVTTFAPCYDATSSRYTFGSDRAFLLLQPELSFLRHHLPKDTDHTEWENPRTIRDETRVKFRAAGRGYHIPSSTKYPMAEHIVKPLDDNGHSVIRWWIDPTKKTRI